MKVYVITKGDYSDYHIVKVYLNLGKALEFLKHDPELMIETYEAEDDYDDRYLYRVMKHFRPGKDPKDYIDEEDNNVV